MRALCWNGVNDLRVESVADPALLNPHDAIIKVRLTTTCGSDLHVIDGLIPTMREGDILGHEFMGEVVEVGSAVKNIRRGDRVVVPSFISCGSCWYCQHELPSCCDNTNPHWEQGEPILGHATAGIYAYSHAFGGYAGSHAEYVRVPFADNDCFVVPDSVSDEQALFLSDAAPTGYMGADFCNIHPGDTVAVWGCGGVGLMAMQSAWLMGAHQVIAIDRFPERLAMAREHAGAITLDYSKADIHEALLELTGGRGPDSCIDAVGMEARGEGLSQVYDRTKQLLHLETDVGAALRQALYSCRKGGNISILGVYGVMDKFPLGLMINKSLTIRTAQQHGQRYMSRLLDHVAKGELNPAFMATHRFSLEEAPRGYEMFKHKEDGCLRAVFAP
jgi:threonine dehydrogenase-like Zn-dependent dehydrogenase